MIPLCCIWKPTIAQPMGKVHFRFWFCILLHFFCPICAIDMLYFQMDVDAVHIATPYLFPWMEFELLKYFNVFLNNSGELRVISLREIKYKGRAKHQPLWNTHQGFRWTNVPLYKQKMTRKILRPGFFLLIYGVAVVN